eukprot:TRINITY_DN65940_c0_g1_i1.p2 TRINITY_DN65940_c0_g1~~TRINITY_DN65940_c0_g1_i1.p2  ORF type:complete len:567 (-),score=287.24 TRINITY_DN65940_c0_g1_i1:67-1767(-)
MTNQFAYGQQQQQPSYQQYPQQQQQQNFFKPQMHAGVHFGLGGPSYQTGGVAQHGPPPGSDGLYHIRIAISFGSDEVPSIEHKNMPMQLRGKMAQQEWDAMLNTCNKIFLDHGSDCYNIGCLFCCCIGGSMVALSRNNEALEMVKEMLVKENRRVWASRGIEWKVTQERVETGRKNQQGQAVYTTNTYLQIDVVPDAPSSHLDQAVQQARAEIERMKQKQQQLEIEAKQQSAGPSVNINVNAAGPFQVLKFQELKLQKELASGAYGRVFAARWRGSRVVVKQLKSSLVNAGMVEDFVAEAQVSEKCGRHPHVVSFVGACTKLPNLCLVFEFVGGGSLEKILIEEKQFARPEDLAIVTQMAVDAAAGVLHLHAEGVVHRDLAARNVLVDEQLRAKVCDFGMSRVREDSEDGQSQTKSNVGPLKWMAPESLRSKVYSPSSDTWMFGVLLYEMFARSEPWPGLTPLNAAIAVSSQNKRMEVPASVPGAVREVMIKCWAELPDDRPTMKQVHSMLLDYLCVLTNRRRPSNAEDVESHQYGQYSDIEKLKSEQQEEEAIDNDKGEEQPLLV